MTIPTPPKQIAKFVIDFETTSRHCGKLFAGTPHDPANQVVLGGLTACNVESAALLEEERIQGYLVKFVSTATARDHFIADFTDYAQASSFLYVLGNAAKTCEELHLIGVNVGFDVSYLMSKFPALWKTIAPKVRLFDVSVAMNFLYGHKHKDLSMDAMSEFFGFPVKPDGIAKYWEAGIDTADIPRQELIDYLIHDLDGTWRLARELMHGAKNASFGCPIPDSPLWQVQMEDLLATTEMEVHGMHFDSKMANSIGMMLAPVLSAKAESLVGQVHSALAVDVAFNIGSNQQVATFLYGGTFTYERDVPILDAAGNQALFKSGPRVGMPRTRKTEYTLHYSTPVTEMLAKHYKDNDAGARSTDDERLCDIRDNRPLSTSMRAWVEILIEWRAMNKDVTTYFLGYPEHAVGNYIHTSYSHTSTATGRLSSSKPNVQNASSAE